MAFRLLLPPFSADGELIVDGVFPRLLCNNDDGPGPDCWCVCVCLILWQRVLLSGPVAVFFCLELLAPSGRGESTGGGGLGVLLTFGSFLVLMYQKVKLRFGAKYWQPCQHHLICQGTPRDLVSTNQIHG